MAVTVRTFQQVALEDPDSKWELARGQLHKKPPMTIDHNRTAFEIAFATRGQLDRNLYEVRADAGYVRAIEHESYIPDAMVIPMSASRRLEGQSGIEEYTEPLPLIVEVWPPSRGTEDRTAKVPE